MLAELRVWVKEVGFPIAVSLLLLGLLLRTIPDLDDRVGAMADTITRHADAATERSGTIIHLLRLICRSEAKDPTTRFECDRGE